MMLLGFTIQMLDARSLPLRTATGRIASRKT